MLAFLWGPGGNGKGVFLNTISKILGDYTKQTSSEVFMTSKYDRHPTELADLKGARMVVGSEVEHNSKWNEYFCILPLSKDFDKTVNLNYI